MFSPFLAISYHKTPTRLESLYLLDKQIVPTSASQACK